MKIAYFSPAFFSDVDLSYIMQAKKMVDIDYYLPLLGHRKNYCAININGVYPRFGIYKATELYPELQPLTNLIDNKHFYVVNSPAKKMWHPQNILLYIKFAWQLRKYDVIHITMFPYYYEWPLYFLRKKIVLTVHDPFPHSDAKDNVPLVMRARARAWRMLNHFIILNDAQMADCIRLNHLEKKHIYSSRLSRYDYLHMYQHANASIANCQSEAVNHKTFLYFGLINHYKGIDILLEAMLKVHEKFPNCRLVIAGRGEWPFDIAPYEYLDYIEFNHRFIPDYELVALINNCTCVVCPYRDATQSGVVMSAFAFNKPVIATNVGGLPEQVIDGKYGRIVPPCDVDALADAMCDMVENPQVISAYAKNIEADYAFGAKSWNAITKNMIKIYQQIVKNI